MPYDYRKMSPAEREEVLRTRAAKGFSLHAPPHPYKGPGCYLITAANFKHYSIMNTVERRTSFESELLDGLQNGPAVIHAWVVMPNHYHVLLTTVSLKEVGDRIAQLHGSTSRRWNIEDGLTGKRRVWYRFTDRGIRDERAFFIEMNYVHYNPLKHGYVDMATDWKCSSIHDYIETEGREWLVEKWKKYPFGKDHGRGWDEYPP